MAWSNTSTATNTSGLASVNTFLSAHLANHRLEKKSLASSLEQQVETLRTRLVRAEDRLGKTRRRFGWCMVALVLVGALGLAWGAWTCECRAVEEERPKRWRPGLRRRREAAASVVHAPHVWAVCAVLWLAILGFALLRGLGRNVFKIEGAGSIVENNINQTVASGVNSASSGVAFTLPALFLLKADGVGGIGEIDPLPFILSGMAGAFLGIVMIIPLRKQMLEYERLRFPSGIAVAALLKSVRVS